MGLGSGYLMEFPLPVPARCRACGNGNRVENVGGYGLVAMRYPTPSR